MKRATIGAWVSVVVMVVAACGHGPSGTDPPDAAAAIDAAPTPAGEVDGPAGAHASVPAGAGIDPSTITIAIATDAPPAGARASVGPIFAFTPHAAQFARPLTIRVPYDAQVLPVDQPPVLYTAEPGGPWTAVPGAHPVGAFVEATVDHFSYYTVGYPARALELVQLGAGQGFSCGLNVTGDVFCWGQDVEGELGNADASAAVKLKPVAVAGSISFVALFVGTIHACAIATTGDTYCWGDDAGGEIGDGDPAHVDTRTPHLVAGHHLFRTLALGNSHTCGITTAGDTYCWGYNGAGQLTDAAPVGDAITDTPVRIAGAFSVIAAGGDTTCGTTVAGDTFCWGDNGAGQLGTGDARASVAQPAKLGRSFSALAVGARHACGIDQAGVTYCWGDDAQGQLGDGAPAATSAVPVAVAGHPAFVAIGSAPGASSTCAIASSGAASCWGRNDHGQLGVGATPAIATTPIAIGTISFGQIAAGTLHGCGLSVAHEAYCWGDQEQGAVGTGPYGAGDMIQPTPRRVDVN